MTGKDELVDIIGRTRLFGGLDVESRQALAAEMRETSFDSGQVIFTRGDEGRDVYVVVSGRIRLSVLTPEGRELSFAHAEAGSVFGEIAMLDGGVRTADATAMTKVEAFSLSRAAFSRVMGNHSSVGEAMLNFLCLRLREADQQLEAIALCPIEVRLARFFLAAASAKDESGEEESVEIPFSMSQSELALLIGASRPKVNTALSLLEGDGALKRSSGKIVCNVELLQDIAGI